MVTPGRSGGDPEFATLTCVVPAPAAHGVRTPGVALVLTGALLALLAFRLLHWYDVPAGHDSAGDVTFGKLHASSEQLGGAGVASAYFGWLAWVLLIAGILVGVAANVPSPAADGLRVAGFLVGLLGVGGTYYALAQHFNATGSKHLPLHNAGWGVWAALVGFLLIAGGAALGPVPPRRAP
jgi:hypothetical protein